MGHWSDELIDELAAKFDPDADRGALKAIASEASKEVELLAGRAFGVTERTTVTVDSGGLPFVEIPDMQVGTYSADADVWPIPDPVHPVVSTVLQLWQLESLPDRAIRIGEALRLAGQLVADAHRTRRLSREYILHQLGTAFDSSQRIEFLRRVADPTNRIQIPIARAQAGGWWIQITRRLVWVTKNTPDERRLLEPLFEEKQAAPLAAVEPILVVSRLTRHPVDWAFSARIWPAVAHRREGSWRLLARAIHGYGIPILTMDDVSSPEETACQLLLLAYWHGYITKEEPGLVDAIALAYPRPVERIRLGTHVPDGHSAAALLLEGLLHPGFDPALGAHSARKYVSSKARIATLEHQKIDDPSLREWQRLGVSERFYYKLLRRFATPEAGKRYADDAVRERIREYLAKRDRQREQRKGVMELLQQRGFGYSAARKWLQRHPLEDAASARPRWRRAARGNL